MLNLPLPSNNILSEDDWNKYLIEHVPALATLWKQDKFELFETYKVLAGFSYAEYILEGSRNFMSELASVQPMLGPTGVILRLKQIK
jgi:hypothetical protein